MSSKPKTLELRSWTEVVDSTRSTLDSLDRVGPGAHAYYRWVDKTAAWYRRFSEIEARGSSPQYERLAETVAANDELLRWLSELPLAKRQPNLLFASVRFLGGPTESVPDFVDYLQSNADVVGATMLGRSTQTNEVARCAAFLPLIADLGSEIALMEVGASAGLCLFPDRYSYSYDGVRVGESTLTIEVDTGQTIEAPRQLPTIIWRRGLDLNPLDVSSPDDLAWLRACIWPEHDERRRQLDIAAAIVANDLPRIDRGDLQTATLDLIDEAPSHAIKVVFHSAVLAYVDQAGRDQFAAAMRSMVEERDDVLWLSNEAPKVLPGIPSPRLDARAAAEPDRFLLVRNGTEPIAHTGPHGRWIRRASLTASPRPRQ